MKRFICVLLVICAAAALITLAACKEKKAEISEYEIFASYDAEARTLKGTVDFTYYNDTGNEIGDLKFNLYGNAFRENAQHKPVSQTYTNAAYYAGVNYGAMTVDGVENCSGWNVGGEDENILTVTLLTPVYPGENVKISISYTLELALVNHRTGITENTVNLGNFYPVLCAYSYILSTVLPPMPRLGTLIIRSTASLSNGFEIIRRYASASFISLRSKKRKPPKTL